MIATPEILRPCQLTQNGDPHQSTNKFQGPQTAQLVRGLKGKNDPDQKRNQENDGGGLDPNLLHLRPHRTPFIGFAAQGFYKGAIQSGTGEVIQSADLLEKIFKDIDKFESSSPDKSEKCSDHELITHHVEGNEQKLV